MSERVSVQIDGVEVHGRPGQTILAVAAEAGIYIPRLCSMKELPAHGSCRVCSVFVNGRAVTACTMPIAEGMVIDNSSERLRHLRRNLIDLLFVEGNHLCMFCEASGRCELQAVAYRLGITAPRYPYRYPLRGVDATSAELFIDFDRCILCARCVQASSLIDHKHALGFVGRGRGKQLAASSRDGLGGTPVSQSDAAARSCPTGALVPKHRGFDVPYGDRHFDVQPIGSEIERRRSAASTGRDGCEEP